MDFETAQLIAKAFLIIVGIGLPLMGILDRINERHAKKQ